MQQQQEKEWNKFHGDKNTEKGLLKVSLTILCLGTILPFQIKKWWEVKKKWNLWKNRACHVIMANTKKVRHCSDVTFEDDAVLVNAVSLLHIWPRETVGEHLILTSPWNPEEMSRQLTALTAVPTNDSAQSVPLHTPPVSSYNGPTAQTDNVLQQCPLLLKKLAA